MNWIEGRTRSRSGCFTSTYSESTFSGRRVASWLRALADANNKVDRNAKGMCYKSWPLFKDWLEIFGRDRATGQASQSFADAVDEVMRSIEPDMEVNTPTAGQESGGAACDNGSGTHGESSSASRKKKTRKRKVHDDVEMRMVYLLDSFCLGTKSGLEELAHHVGFQQDAKQHRKDVCGVLKGTMFLSGEDKLAIAQRLCRYFFNISHEEQVLMVRMMLGRM